MFQRVLFFILISTVFTGCQSVSDEELEYLNSRALQAEQQEKENKKLKEAQKSLIEGIQLLNKQLEKEVAKKQVSIEENQTTGGIKVTLQEAILFPSNTYEIDQEGAADILRKLSSGLDKNNTNIQIVGHTDNLPITKKWRDKFSDNWDLSARRAGEVARFLIWGAGYPKEKITVIGRSDVEPVASNKTEEGRSKNRRIEILISQ